MARNALTGPPQSLDLSNGLVGKLQPSGSLEDGFPKELAEFREIIPNLGKVVREIASESILPYEVVARQVAKKGDLYEKLAKDLQLFEIAINYLDFQSQIGLMRNKLGEKERIYVSAHP